MKKTLQQIVLEGLQNPTYFEDIEKGSESGISYESSPHVRILDTTKRAELRLTNGNTSYSDIIKAANNAGLDIDKVIEGLDKLVDGNGNITKSNLQEILTQ
jgi:hypothetical protein